MCDGREREESSEHPLQPGFGFWREKILHLILGRLLHSTPMSSLIFQLRLCVLSWRMLSIMTDLSQVVVPCSRWHLGHKALQAGSMNCSGE